MQFLLLLALSRGAVVPRIQSLVLDARIQEAAAEAEAAVSEDAALTADEALGLAELCGDLLLALDRPEEAEAMYRQAVKAAVRQGEKGATRLAACRATGMMSLHQRRLGIAASCFMRIAADEQASALHKGDALCALAVARHGLGRTERAQQLLAEAAEWAAAAGATPLPMVVSLLQVEMAAQQQIRAHEALGDHVFWQSQDGELANAAPIQPMSTMAACLKIHGHHRYVAQVLEHYSDLLMGHLGDARAIAALPAQLARLRRAGLGTLERAARIETALVGLATRHAELARAVLEPLQAHSARVRWNMETLYCFAKLSALTGRIEDSMHWYQRYAMESMQCVRAESLRGEPAAAAPRTASMTRSDELEVQLPAKYRRAYRYMIEHLEFAELSVREIADHIGVTERALQLTFRSHLGTTPAELLQRCRMERIRIDLLRDDRAAGSVLETAAKWGIRNRSTLASSYRKYFQETPTQTLARREVHA